MRPTYDLRTTYVRQSASTRDYSSSVAVLGVLTQGILWVRSVPNGYLVQSWRDPSERAFMITKGRINGLTNPYL